ncbi:heterotrimeric G-protein alpha subunit, GPA3-like protein [Flammula alnicola]|nr:heterotrimeric G-protein alpha subunit, GPA3-like protein [Flammula alnicola]
MGGCIPTVDRSGKEQSDLIDKQIEEDCKHFKCKCKILLLGAGESGKSTIVKQMKIIHQDGFSDTELAEYRLVVYKNVLDSAQQVIVYMKKIGFECVEYSNRVHPPLLSPFLIYFHSCLSDTFIPKALADEVLDFRLDTTSSTPYFPPEIAEAIHKLWKDSIIPKMMDGHSSDFYLMDSAAYFFEEVLCIGSPGYLPNETDVLRARRKSEAITETRFTMGQLSIHMFDVGGQQSERMKWIHCFESVTSIIFCTALSEYDQVLLEEKTQNRMQESLILFESVINSRWFLQTSIILFLNKIDVFKNKVPKVLLERYFPDYRGGPDINKAAKYILIYPHLMQATDTMNIQLVFAAVKETILQNALKDSGIL